MHNDNRTAYKICCTHHIINTSTPHCAFHCDGLDSLSSAGGMYVHLIYPKNGDIQNTHPFMKLAQHIHASNIQPNQKSSRQN